MTARARRRMEDRMEAVTFHLFMGTLLAFPVAIMWMCMGG
jgi:hypothetical protein